METETIPIEGYIRKKLPAVEKSKGIHVMKSNSTNLNESDGIG